MLEPIRVSAAVAAPVPASCAFISRREVALLASSILAFGCISICLGKDRSWDFLNYHWYDAYAFLNHRIGFDVAVAHHATYYNPLIHVPFYWLATICPVWVALLYAGVLHGLNVPPLYLIARSALNPPVNRVLAFGVALAGLGGSTVVSMIGNTSYDTALSALVFGGLAVLIVKRDALRVAPAPAARAAAGAGFLIGVAVGLKLVEVFYAIGLAIVLLALPGRTTVRCARLLAGGTAGIIAVLLCAGFWFWTLMRETGNPLFPMYNSIFHSALISPTYFGSTNFSVAGFWPTVTFPFRFLIDYRIADDAPFRDLRVPLLYVVLPVASVCFATAARTRSAQLLAPGATRILFLFTVVSYLVWLEWFAVYRYLVGLEMLAPVLILAALDCLPVSSRRRVTLLAGILVVAALCGRYSFANHGDARDPYVRVQGLSFADPASTLLLMTGHEPMAYLIPSLPPRIAVLRIDGWLAQPDDGSGLTALMRARVDVHAGGLFLIAAPDEHRSAIRATAAYGLDVVTEQCHEVRSNLGGPYELCPLRRQLNRPD